MSEEDFDKLLESISQEYKSNQDKSNQATNQATNQETSDHKETKETKETKDSEDHLNNNVLLDSNLNTNLVLDFHRASLTAEQFLRLFAQLSISPHIGTLNIVNSPDIIFNKNNKNDATTLINTNGFQYLRKLSLVLKLSLKENTPLLENIAHVLRDEHCCLRVLNLSGCGLSADHATILVDALKHNHSLVSLNLSHNLFPSLGLIENARATFFKTLGDMLSVNETLEELDLSNCKLLWQELKPAGVALQQNKTLKKLEVNVNPDLGSDFFKINMEGEADFMLSLSKNTGLKSLNVTPNPFYGRAIKAPLADMLTENKNLEEITFHSDLTLEQELCAALRANCRIKSLNISFFLLDSYKSVYGGSGMLLFRVIPQNIHLTTLSITLISDLGLISLGNCLSTNKTIQNLSVYYNFTISGKSDVAAMEFFQAIKDNSTLKSLELDSDFLLNLDHNASAAVKVLCLFLANAALTSFNFRNWTTSGANIKTIFELLPRTKIATFHLRGFGAGLWPYLELLLSNPNLTELSLASCELGNHNRGFHGLTGCQAFDVLIIAMSQNKTLRTLILNDNPIGTQGIQKLLKNLSPESKLCELSLDHILNRYGTKTSIDNDLNKKCAFLLPELEKNTSLTSIHFGTEHRGAIFANTNKSYDVRGFYLASCIFRRNQQRKQKERNDVISRELVELGRLRRGVIGIINGYDDEFECLPAKRTICSN